MREGIDTKPPAWYPLNMDTNPLTNIPETAVDDLMNLSNTAKQLAEALYNGSRPLCSDDFRLIRLARVGRITEEFEIALTQYLVNGVTAQIAVE